MAKASVQSSADDQKPSRNRGIKGHMRTPTRPSAHSSALTAVQATREFDLWLRRELCRLHDDVMHEPIPEKLLSIIEDEVRTRD